MTGSAKIAVISDIAKWNATITRTVKQSGLKNGYSQIETDAKTVKNFLVTQGFKEGDFTISPVFMDQNYDYSQNRDPNAEREYNLRQNITLSSSDVSKVKDTADKVSSLAAGGILLSAGSLEYYYSKLAELRVNLLSDAVKDAKVRAEKLAESGGQGVGALKSAASGVVQVISPNSVDVSDYGSYDTSSLEKEVMVTVKASFVLK